MGLVILSGSFLVLGIILVIVAAHSRSSANAVILLFLGVVAIIFCFVAMVIYKHEQAKTKAELQAKIVADIESRTFITRGGVAARFYSHLGEAPKCFITLNGLPYRFVLPQEFLLSCPDIYPKDLVKITFVEPLDPSQEDVEVLEFIDLTYEVNTWRLDTKQYPTLLQGWGDASKPTLKSQQRKAEEL